MNINWFDTPFNSPLLLSIVGLYFVMVAMATFLVRIEQCKKRGLPEPSIAYTPAWTDVSIPLTWILLIGLILLNPMVAAACGVTKGILRVLTVMETIGAFLFVAIVGNKTATETMDAMRRL